MRYDLHITRNGAVVKRKSKKLRPRDPDPTCKKHTYLLTYTYYLRVILRSGTLACYVPYVPPTVPPLTLTAERAATHLQQI